MLKPLLTAGILVGSFLGALPVRAHHYPVLDCSVVSGNVYGYGACEDRNRKLQKEANRSFRSQVKANPQLCNTPNLKHYGVYTVGACEDINRRYRRQQERAVSNGISNGSIQLPYKYIPNGGHYPTTTPQYYPQSQSRCDLVIAGQCYRQRH